MFNSFKMIYSFVVPDLIINLDAAPIILIIPIKYILYTDYTEMDVDTILN